MQHAIQVRHVPEALHRQLKMRAARQGKTLSEYLLGELRVIANRPTLDEVFERIRRREPVKLRSSIAQAVRAERESRR